MANYPANVILTLILQVSVSGQSTTSDDIKCQSKEDAYREIQSEIRTNHFMLMNQQQEMKNQIRTIVQSQQEIKNKIQALSQERINGSICPPGFMYLPNADGCYKVVSETKSNWSSAFQKCQDLFHGAHLAVITSENESDTVKWFLRSYFSNNPNINCRENSWKEGGNAFWIGLQRSRFSDCSSNFDFVWHLPGEIQLPMNFSDWAPHQPNCAKNTKEPCVMIWPNEQYGWNDLKCEWEICAVCEYNPPF